MFWMHRSSSKFLSVTNAMFRLDDRSILDGTLMKKMWFSTDFIKISFRAENEFFLSVLFFPSFSTIANVSH
jgi:hypothetical protein